MMGLIVEASSNHLTKDDKKHELGELVGDQLPKMVAIEVDAVGGVDCCIEAMVEAGELGLECRAISCPNCRLPHLDEGEWLKPHQRHLCRGCGHKWERTPKVVGNPLATVLTPAVVATGLKDAEALNAGDVGFVGNLGGDGELLEDEEMDGAPGGVTSGLQQKLLRSWGVNTDAPRYVTQTGKVVRGGGKRAPYAPADLATVVQRLKMTVPMLTYAKYDRYMRMMALASLLKMCKDNGELVPAP